MKGDAYRRVDGFRWFPLTQVIISKELFLVIAEQEFIIELGCGLKIGGASRRGQLAVPVQLGYFKENR